TDDFADRVNPGDISKRSAGKINGFEIAAAPQESVLDSVRTRIAPNDVSGRSDGCSLGVDSTGKVKRNEPLARIGRSGTQEQQQRESTGRANVHFGFHIF